MGVRRTSGRRARRAAPCRRLPAARRRGRPASLEEVLDVEEEGRGRREDGDVTGPAEPLVALRAVGWHVEEVAARPPHHVAMELVEQLV